MFQSSDVSCIIRFIAFCTMHLLCWFTGRSEWNGRSYATMKKEKKKNIKKHVCAISVSTVRSLCMFLFCFCFETVLLLFLSFGIIYKRMFSVSFSESSTVVNCMRSQFKLGPIRFVMGITGMKYGILESQARAGRQMCVICWSLKFYSFFFFYHFIIKDGFTLIRCTVLWHG